MFDRSRRRCTFSSPLKSVSIGGCLLQETASTPSTLMPPSAAAAAASDAAPDGKKQRTGQQSRGSQQQQALGPEQDSLSRDAVPSATS